MTHVGVTLEETVSAIVQLSQPMPELVMMPESVFHGEAQKYAVS